MPPPLLRARLEPACSSPASCIFPATSFPPANVLSSLVGSVKALLHNGRREEAVDCARIAFELRPQEEEVANICAWIFSNCGRWSEAATAYEQLLEIRPGWAEGHRHASGSFAAAGQLDRAIFHASRASDLAPNAVEFATHAACQYEAAGHYEDAVAYLVRAAAVEPADSRVLRQPLSAVAVATLLANAHTIRQYERAPWS